MSGTLVVAGTAGSIILAKINSDTAEREVQVLDLTIKAYYMNLCCLHGKM
jgi:hypothetical protein